MAKLQATDFSWLCPIAGTGPTAAQEPQSPGHCFPRDDDGEPVNIEPYEDDFSTSEGAINGIKCGLLGWVVLLLLAWWIWRWAGCGK